MPSSPVAPHTLTQRRRSPDFVFAALVDGFGRHEAALWLLTLLPVVAVLAPAFVRPSQFNNAVRQRTD